MPDTFGTRTRQLRLAAGLTQEQLAARSGVVVRTIQYVETGLINPRGLTRKAIAEALGVNLDQLEAAS